MKFDGNILDDWFQDKLSREKVKLSEHFGELSKLKKGKRVKGRLKVVAQALFINIPAYY